MHQHDTEADHQRLLTIYLQDHRAGAEAGVRLAERCRDHAPDADTKTELSTLVTEIDDDRRTLATMMAGLDVDPSTVKQITALAAERLGRLKLNGRAVRTSPLSVLVELEGLIGAVSMKRQLWATLGTLAARGPRRDTELEALIERADDQRTRLQTLHGQVAAQVFETASNPAPGPPTGTTTASIDAGSGHA
jgi:predicted DNA-binding ribbon-helix-helix protein